MFPGPRQILKPSRPEIHELPNGPEQGAEPRHSVASVPTPEQNLSMAIGIMTARIDDLAEKLDGDRKAMFYGAPAPDRFR